MNACRPGNSPSSAYLRAALHARTSLFGGERLPLGSGAGVLSGTCGDRIRDGAARWSLHEIDARRRCGCPAAADGISQAFAKLMIPVVLGALSIVILHSMPLAHGDGRSGISPSEFQRYRSQQEFELEREQALRSRLNAPQSIEEAERQRGQFERERSRQDLLLERQRRRLASEGAESPSVPRLEASQGITLQRLQREQASERLSRKLTR
jgi:hypothetical protein